MIVYTNKDMWNCAFTCMVLGFITGLAAAYIIGKAF